MSYDNRKLIWNLKQKGVLKSPEVEKALIEFPRERFIPANVKMFANQDIPVPIGYKQTISQPTTVIIMTQSLDVQKNDKILEIGTGSGWQAAILSFLTKKNVYSIERIPELKSLAKSNLEQFKIKNLKLLEGDGTKGYKKAAPFDKIIVTAASPEIPQPLIDQLKVGGMMIIPVGDQYLQEMILITKKSKKIINKKSIGHFTFVPLLGKYGFKETK